MKAIIFIKQIVIIFPTNVGFFFQRFLEIPGPVSQNYVVTKIYLRKKNCHKIQSQPFHKTVNCKFLFLNCYYLLFTSYLLIPNTYLFILLFLVISNFIFIFHLYDNQLQSQDQKLPKIQKTCFAKLLYKHVFQHEPEIPLVKKILTPKSVMTVQVNKHFNSIELLPEKLQILAYVFCI